MRFSTFNIVACSLIVGVASMPTTEQPVNVNDINMTVNDLLAAIIPLLDATQGLINGVAQGLEGGASNVNAAVRDVGEAVQQASDAAGDIAQGVTEGTGETIVGIPGDTVNALQNADKAVVDLLASAAIPYTPPK